MNLINNVSKLERIVCAGSGLALLAKAYRGQSKNIPPSKLVTGSVYAIGSGLLMRGLSGYCPGYAAFGVDMSSGNVCSAKAEEFKSSVMIGRPKDEVIKAITSQSDRFIHGEREGEFFITVSDVPFSLMVSDRKSSRQTKVTALVKQPAGTSLKAVAARLAPTATIKLLLNMELRNLKALIETGEIATTAGQPHGDRSLLGKATDAMVQPARESLDEFSRTLLPGSQAGGLTHEGSL